MTRLARRAPLLVLLLVGALLTGCGGGSSSSDEPTRIVVALDWTPNTNHSGVYLARKEGLYADAGLDVEIVEPDPSGAIAQLAAGNADFAFSYAEQMIPARADGSRVVSIASVLRTNTSSLVAPADRGIRRPRDLEGKTYGTYGGAIERPWSRRSCAARWRPVIRFVDVRQRRLRRRLPASAVRLHLGVRPGGTSSACATSRRCRSRRSRSAITCPASDWYTLIAATDRRSPATRHRQTVPRRHGRGLRARGEGPRRGGRGHHGRGPRIRRGAPRRRRRSSRTTSPTHAAAGAIRSPRSGPTSTRSSPRRISPTSMT